MTMTPDDLPRRLASIRSFGVTSSEAAAISSAIARIPLPPHLEAMLAAAGEAVRPGWWMTPKGWAARWRFKAWRRGMRRGGEVRASHSSER